MSYVLNHEKVKEIIILFSKTVFPGEITTLLLQTNSENVVVNKLILFMNQYFLDIGTEDIAITEWNPQKWLRQKLERTIKIDIAVLKESMNNNPRYHPSALFECKNTSAPFVLKKGEIKDTIWRYSNGTGILQDLGKMESVRKEWNIPFHQILGISILKGEIPDKYLSILKNQNKVNLFYENQNTDYIIKLVKERLTKQFLFHKLYEMGYKIEFVESEIGYSNTFQVDMKLVYMIVSKDI